MVLVLPYPLETEDQFDIQDCKGEKAGQGNGDDCPRMPWLNRNLAGNRMDPSDLVVPRLRLDITVPAADKDKGHLSEKPQGEQSNQSAKGKGGARGLRPNEEVQDKAQAEKQSWE